MQEQNSKEITEHRSGQDRLRSVIRHIILPLAVLGCGVAITMYLLNTSPEAKPQKRPPAATLVEIENVVAGPQKTFISAMGEVVPAREIELRSRVSGEIIAIAEDFIPGGYFSAGELLLQIDPADYRLIIRQLESEVARVESDIAVEMGNQRIAEKEYALLGEAVSREERDLILRKPQLEKLLAARELAQAQLAQAKLDLQRTEITAPFNCVIDSRKVDIGARVNESTILAHLVGSDAFWLRVTLPVEQLQWLNIPGTSNEEGSLVGIFSQGVNGMGSSRIRYGRVIRLAASLEEQGRMAQLLIRVEDPLSRLEENSGKTKLLLGSYVRAELEGITIDSAVGIDRANLHEGNTVWLMREDNTLEIREVEVVFRDRDKVIVTAGIEEGDRLITSTLVSPIAGIPLQEVRTVEEMTRAAADAAANGSQEPGHAR